MLMSVISKSSNIYHSVFIIHQLSILKNMLAHHNLSKGSPHKRLLKLTPSIKQMVRHSQSQTRKHHIIDQLLDKFAAQKAFNSKTKDCFQFSNDNQDKHADHHPAIHLVLSQKQFSVKALNQKYVMKVLPCPMKCIEKDFSLEKTQNGAESIEQIKNKKLKMNLFANMQDLPKSLSKKSTDYSNDNSVQIQKLQEQNLRMKKLCSIESDRTEKLQEAINQEKKIQRIRRHLYKQSLHKLEMMAELQMVNAKEIEEELSKIQKDDEEVDCLSIESR